jgi:hypothetical protein
MAQNFLPNFEMVWHFRKIASAQPRRTEKFESEFLKIPYLIKVCSSFKFQIVKHANMQQNINYPDILDIITFCVCVSHFLQEEFFSVKKIEM